MPQLKYTREAISDLGRISDFMKKVSPDQLTDALQTIQNGLKRLTILPNIGKSVAYETLPNLRQLSINYGKSGYIALYVFDEENDEVVIVGIRHKRELEFEILRD
ncbi:MAG: type II toxin-antitoxin system RelE/ParE family toxin [Acinetobacter sp.]|nr:type II toxin-antitoxin system RelE/ParE family toxin [Acinetobacter sp.]